MKLNTRRLEEQDYSTLCKWWEDWGFKPIPKDFLPENGTGGMMILDKDIPVCAGFLYTSNAKLAYINFIISNKQYRKKPHRTNAIELLLNSLITICNNTGLKYIYANNNNKYLIKHFEKLGFNKTTNNMTELIKIISWE